MAEQYKSPGWYPDPEGKPGERWWNGAGWSDTRRGGAPAAPQPLATVPAPPAVQRPDPYARTYAPIATPPRATLDFRQNRFAALSFILGLVGLFGFSIAGPAAVVLGILGISRARKLAAGGGPANIVFPAIGIVAGAIATFVLLITVAGFFGALMFDVDG